MVAIPFSSTLRGRAQQLGRDIRVVVAGLRGYNPPPLVERGPSPYRETDDATDAASSEAAARAFTVAERIDETADAVSLVLTATDGQPVRVVPGQFFTLLVDVDGQTYRRAYSASSDCRDTSKVRLTIKRVADGRVSNHINNNVHAGDTVRALGPSGNFVCAAAAGERRHVVLLGGGSGITPLMAIARGILHDEPQSRVTLVYGNRGADDIIFANELAGLASDFGDRFDLRLLLENPPAGWQGGAGRLDSDGARAELERLAAAACDRPAQYFICGPAPMMDATRQVLLDRGVAEDVIFEERFSSPHLRSESTAGQVGASQAATIRVGGREYTTQVEPGQTLLDAGLAAGAAMKFSCAMGGCGACKVKVHAGDVEMEEPNCLSAAERKEGYTLACVARACSAVDIEVE